MSAEVLREAAALMRERAEKATPGPWQWGEPSSDSWPHGDQNLWTVATDEAGVPEPVVTSWGYDADGIDASGADRAHIASWHPAVALAVADWLEHAASAMEFDAGVGLTEAEATQGFEPALAVAKAYLGHAP